MKRPQYLILQQLTGPRTGLALLFALVSLPASAKAAPQCGDWDLVPTPNVGDRTNWISAVTALSSDDAWAVGLWRNLSGTFGPVAMRWNGTAWSMTSLPDTSHLGGLPETPGVEAASNGDVWVVGKVFVGYPYDNRPLVLRWRGGSWDYVDTVTLRPQTVYPFAPRGGILDEAAAMAPDDVWAVGLAAGFGDGAATTVPLAIHWDGSSWTDVDVPRISNRHHELNDVVAIATDDVWAVGDYRNEPGAFHAVTYHWDGTAWSHVHNPIEDLPGDGGLDDVVATGPNDVWAIGGIWGGGPRLMHWNGTQWSLMPPPPNSGGSLAAVGPNDLWVSGWDGFWHWDGSAWTAVPASVPGASYVIRNGGMEIVGGCDIWCAGFWTLSDGITGYTLAERLQRDSTSFCFGDGSAGACPCGNSGSSGHGCQNSGGTGGSILFSSGVASLSADTLLHTATGERPTALSIFLQGDAAVAPVFFGDGLRCTGGVLKRLYVKNASGGVVTAPQPGDPSVSARSAALGDPIPTGATRDYQVYYRDASANFCPVPLGGTFNASNGIAVIWAQ